MQSSPAPYLGHASSKCRPARPGFALTILFALIAPAALFALACSQAPTNKEDQIRELQAAGQIKESIPLLIELIESGNRDGEFLFRYGRAVSLTGEPARSVWALDAAREDPEWFVQASMQLARDAYRANNLDFAIEILERLKDEREDDYEDDLPALLLEARVRVNTRRDYEESLALSELILEKYPGEEEAVRVKAASLLGLKRTDEAYEWIKQAGVLDGEAESDDDDPLIAEPAADEDESLDVADNTDREEREGLDLGLDDREAYWCTVRATFKREAGETEEALQIVDDCIERFPSTPGLLNEAVKIYAETGRSQRVQEVLEAAHADQPLNQEIRGALVKHLNVIGDKEGAEATLRAALEDAQNAQPPEPLRVASLWVDLAGYLIEIGKVDEGLEAYDEADQILGDRISPELLFRYAEALILAEDYDNALEIADRTEIEVHKPMIRGRVAFERSEYERAIEQFNEASLHWPDNAPVRYYLARAYEGVGDFDRAVEEYRQSMRADPGLSAARERLTRLHLAEGQVREASTILQFVSPLSPSSPSIPMQILMVETLSRLGMDPNMNIAPAPGGSPEELRSDTVEAFSRGLKARGGRRGAESVLAELESHVVPIAQPVFSRARVELLIEDDAPDEALALARGSLESHPNDDNARVALGLALAASGESEEAMKRLAEISDRRPKDATLWTVLGELQRAQGREEAAEASFEAILAKKPGHWPALAGLLEILEGRGEDEAALARLERFVRFDGPYEGNAALALARRIEGSRDSERRIALARQAIRFGGGQEAVDFGLSLDPTIAADLRPIPRRFEKPTEPKAEADPDAGAPDADPDQNARSPETSETQGAS